jgi:hypothetical protein
MVPMRRGARRYSSRNTSRGRVVSGALARRNPLAHHFAERKGRLNRPLDA